jgi:fatty acid desaturase
MCLAASSAVIWVTRGTWLMAPAMIFQGWVLVALFACVHETIHYTAFRTRRLNEVVGWLAATPSLLNSTWYRMFHTDHHRYCQDRARDPELTPPPPVGLWEYLARASGLSYWRARAVTIARVLAGRFDAMPYVPAIDRTAVRRSMQAMVLLAGGALTLWIALGGWDPIVYWIAPVVLGQPILRLMLLAEHTGCSEDDNPLTNTRTTAASWPVRLLHWNMPYHAEHHLYPSIPFHALPHARTQLSGAFAHATSGYRASHRAVWYSVTAKRH